MFDFDRWTEIWVTITRNKTRSLMTCWRILGNLDACDPAGLWYWYGQCDHGECKGLFDQFGLFLFRPDK